MQIFAQATLLALFLLAKHLQITLVHSSPGSNPNRGLYLASDGYLSGAIRLEQLTYVGKFAIPLSRPLSLQRPLALPILPVPT
jgi:hypothetical protein